MNISCYHKYDSNSVLTGTFCHANHEVNNHCKHQVTVGIALHHKLKYISVINLLTQHIHDCNCNKGDNQSGVRSCTNVPQVTNYDEKSRCLRLWRMQQLWKGRLLSTFSWWRFSNIRLICCWSMQRVGRWRLYFSLLMFQTTQVSCITCTLADTIMNWHHLFVISS